MLGVWAKKLGDNALGNNQLKEQVELIRNVQLRSALCLGRDGADFEGQARAAGRNEGQIRAVLDAMQGAFKELEARAAEL